MSKEIIFLSDIHGNFEALQHLNNLPEMNNHNVEFWFGGDYSDGFNLSPNATINTWNFIKNLCDSGKAQAIIGNHDEFIIDAAYRPDKYTWWEHNGRGNTLDNLGLSFTNQHELREQLLYHYYDQMEWLKSLPLSLETEHLLMIHAGVDLDVALNQQSKDTLLWIREPYIYAEQNLNIDDIHSDFKNKTLISGHSPTVYIDHYEFGLCPIVTKKSIGLTRYFIDGGSKGGPNIQGRINLLKLDEFGNEIWKKYATQDGIFDY